jgi:ribonuclease P protein component
VTISRVEDRPDLPPRVAFSIGRQVGPAVVRNKLRRRIRSVLRETRPPLAPGAYLVSARPEAAQLSFDELRAALRRSLRQVARPGAPLAGDHLE